MLRRTREIIASLLFKLAAALFWLAALTVPRSLPKPVKDQFDPQLKKLIDAATLPLPDRTVEAIKLVQPVIRPETDEERAALSVAIDDAQAATFEEEIHKAIIDALKDETKEVGQTGIKDNDE